MARDTLKPGQWVQYQVSIRVDAPNAPNPQIFALLKQATEHDGFLRRTTLEVKDDAITVKSKTSLSDTESVEAVTREFAFSLKNLVAAATKISAQHKAQLRNITVDKVSYGSTRVVEMKRGKIKCAEIFIDLTVTAKSSQGSLFSGKSNSYTCISERIPYDGIVLQDVVSTREGNGGLTVYMSFKKHLVDYKW